MNKWLAGILGAGLLGGLAATPVAAATSAPPRSSVRAATLYAAPTGTSGANGHSCQTAVYSTIGDAVAAASAGDTVVVCAGTYAESVTVDKKLTLRGQRGAIVDASGQPYGIGVTASYVSISGFTVENASADDGAPGDGIITAGFTETGPAPADHISITGNVLHDNAGAGIDVNSSSYSSVTANDSEHNGIGINVSDDLGAPASHNSINANITSNNPGGCGIVLADHSGLGIFSNSVIGNVADANGLGSPSAPDASAGSGIILAGGSGGVYDNLIVANEFTGNGHAGVALHAHAPGMNMSGNLVALNRIGTNNLRTDYADTSTTGIYLADASPLTITVIGNQIHDDQIGIFTAGDVTVTGETLNVFHNVTTKTASTPTYGG